MSALNAAANVCGLWEMCYQELVNIVLAETHTREDSICDTIYSQITFHMLSELQKNQTAILKLAICLSAFCYLFQWNSGEGERKGGVGIFYESLLGSLSVCFYSIVLQRTRIEARDDIVVKGSTLSHTWSDTNLFSIVCHLKQII